MINEINELIEVSPELEQKYTQVKLSDKELLEIFPEAQEIIPEKLREWEEKREEWRREVKEKLKGLKKLKNETARKIGKIWIKINDGKELLEIDRQIKRLTLLFWLNLKKDKPDTYHSPQKIQEASSIPILNIASQEVKCLRKVSKNYVGLCPLHQEKHPSFYLYPETNSFYCFGCNKGGDVIKLVELLYNLPFREAVKYLINYGGVK